MRAKVRGSLPLVAAVVVTAVLVSGGPPLAAAVFDAVNADKVDGRHAVGADATPSQRANKLVATNGSGRLPNDIITKAPDADRLDGLSSAAYQKRVTGSCAPAQKISAVGAGGGVTCAVDRINGGNAASLQGFDASDFQPGPSRTILVPRGDSSVDNGTRLAGALAGLPTGSNQPSISNPWQVLLEPGTYQLSDTLVLPAFVTLRGSGAGTVVACACATIGTAIRVDSYSSIEQLRLSVDGQTDASTVYGVVVPENANARLDEVEIDVTNAGSGYGISGYTVEMMRSSVQVSSTGSSSGIELLEFASVTDSDIGISGDGAAIVAKGGTLRARNVSLYADGAGGIGVQVGNFNGFEGSARISGSWISASTEAVDINTEGLVRVDTTMLKGTVTVTVAATCVASYTASFEPRNAICQVDG